MSTLYSAVFATFLAGAPIGGLVGLCGEPTSLEDSNERDLSQILTHTVDLLADAGVEARVTGRVKSLDSLYAKMHRKGLKQAEIEDRIGLRIEVDTEAECYAVRELIRDAHEPVMGSDDDYIAYPKPNGYQSLHTVAHTAPSGVLAEFQIRTTAMHEYAVNGPAAHWVYKMSA